MIMMMMKRLHNFSYKLATVPVMFTLQVDRGKGMKGRDRIED